MISQVRKRLRLLPKSLKLSLAVIGTRIASGFIGIFCHYLLEFIQVIVFGKDKGNLQLQFQSVSAFRRLSVLLVVGILSSLFWYFLQCRVTLLSISKAKKLVGKRNPNFLGQSSTCINPGGNRCCWSFNRQRRSTSRIGCSLWWESF